MISSIFIIISMFYSIYFQNIDAPEVRRDDVKDILGKTNVLEIDTIKHADNDKDATNYFTILVLNLLPDEETNLN